MAVQIPPTQAWWSLSVESTLTWPSLRPYNLLQVPLTSAADVDEHAESIGRHIDPRFASVRLPAHLHAIPSRGALDDSVEMRQLLDRFVKYIHAKQPIVDIDLLYNQIAVVEEEGLGWDAPTCLLVFSATVGRTYRVGGRDFANCWSVDCLRAGRYLHAVRA